MTLIRSISGLRATLGDSLTPDVIAAYCSAFSSILPDGEIIIGRDGRPSGKWIEQVAAGALSACGRNVRILGIVPTPTVQLVTEKSEAAGGIAITASHNPSQWNGLKFIGGDGVFLDSAGNVSLWNSLDKKSYKYPDNTDQSNIIFDEDAIRLHIIEIFRIGFLTSLIFEKIRNRKFKVVVDAVNASGSVAVPRMLETLGCDVVRLFCDSSGIFPHLPEPLPENLSMLADAVKETCSDAGIAVDPDADRLVLIDDTGTPIGEENTITLAVQSALTLIKMKNQGKASIVINHSTTRTVEDIAAKFGAEVFRSPVGEINVIGLMKMTGAVIGGEGSGGVILPQCHYGRDSLVGIALILALIAESGKSLSELAGELPKYCMIKTKKPFSGEINVLIQKTSTAFPDAKVICEDGVKVIYPRSWVQLRGSNTEPIIRIIAEAPERSQAEELIAKINSVCGM